MSEFLFSGEPLPLAPPVDDPELAAFHRQVIDYLRRLTQKIQSNEFIPPSGGGGGALSMLALGLANDITMTGSGTYDPVTWDLNIRRDTATFSHDPDGANPEQITVLKDGTYLFLLELGYTTDAEPSTDSITSIIVGPGGTLNYSASYKVGGGTQMASITPVTLFANDTIEIQVADSDTAGTRKLYPGDESVGESGTRLTVLYLPSLTDTTDPVDSTDPHKFFTP